MEAVPGEDAVLAYVGAYFLAPEELLALARLRSELTLKMLLNVVSCGTIQKLPRKQRTEVQNALEDIAKSRIRRPLWQTITQGQILDSRQKNNETDLEKSKKIDSESKL